MNARIERVVTVGRIGVGREGAPPEGFELENNVWIVGDDESVIVVDAAHDAEAIAAAVDGREVLGLLLTHGHEDHVNAALETAALLDTHVYLHPADLFLWEETHGDAVPDFELAQGASFEVAGTALEVLHTPGHTPGSVCFALPALGTVLTGDTLFRGGPGATRWAYSSFPTIVESIEAELFPLPSETVARPGHGADTTIGEERPQLQAWLQRGW
ncbi:MBL fold metallo-hydrolase [Leucobacter sp. CSA2]|uniref:MBL fold metallo-hydrolase n=1 Tax=Leucobacter edaphi TaxID=2796472 RepID=A0A934UXF1_9MICO|nr:MBL fold metallo-hydrolase [Leucobacter edaphi]